jgi:hypothetical protein
MQLENTAPPFCLAWFKVNLLLSRVRLPEPVMDRAPPSVTDALQLKNVELVISEVLNLEVVST